MTYTVTKDWQITVPKDLRQNLDLRKGSKILLIETTEGFEVKTISKTDFTQFAGLLPGKGKALRALLKEREKG